MSHGLRLEALGDDEEASTIVGGAVEAIIADVERHQTGMQPGAFETGLGGNAA